MLPTFVIGKSGNVPERIPLLGLVFSVIALAAPSPVGRTEMASRVHLR
jgi:hypothetical protein